MAHVLWLRNLSQDASENDIYDFFCGLQISSIRIHFAAGKDNEANITFAHKDELMKALELNNQPLCGKPVNLLLFKNNEESGEQTFDQRADNGKKHPLPKTDSDDVYDNNDSDCKRRSLLHDDGNLSHLHRQGVDTTFVGQTMFGKTSEPDSCREGQQLLGTAEWDTPAATRSYWERYQQPGPPKMWPWYCVTPGSNSLKSANPPGPISADPFLQASFVPGVKDVGEPTTPKSTHRARKKKALAGNTKLFYIYVTNIAKFKQARELWSKLKEVLGKRPLQVRLGKRNMVSSFAFAIYDRRFQIPHLRKDTCLKFSVSSHKHMNQRLRRLKSGISVANDSEKEYRTKAKVLIETPPEKILELMKQDLNNPVPGLKLVRGPGARSKRQEGKSPDFHIRISNVKKREAMHLWKRLHSLGANPVVVRLVQDPQATDLFAYATCYEQFSIPEVMKDSTFSVVPSSEDQMLEEFEHLDPQVTITEARRYVKAHEVTRQLKKKVPSSLEKEETNTTQPHQLNTQDIDLKQHLPKTSDIKIEHDDPAQNAHVMYETSEQDIIPTQPQSNNVQDISPTKTSDIKPSVSKQDVSSTNIADIMTQIDTQDVDSSQTADITPDVRKQEVNLSETAEILSGVSTQDVNPAGTADTKSDIDKQNFKQIQAPHIVSNVNKQDINPTQTPGGRPGPPSTPGGRNQNILPSQAAPKKPRRRKGMKKVRGKKKAHGKKKKKENTNTTHAPHTAPGLKQQNVNPAQPSQIAPGIKRPNMNPPHAAPNAKRQRVNQTQPQHKIDWRKKPKTQQKKWGKKQAQKQQVNTAQPPHDNNMHPVKGRKSKQKRSGGKGKKKSNGPPMCNAQQACLNLIHQLHTKQNKRTERSRNWAQRRKQNAPS